MGFAGAAAAPEISPARRSGSALGSTKGVLQWFEKQRVWRREHEAAFRVVTVLTSSGLTIFQHRAMEAVAASVPPDSFRQVPMDNEPGVYLLASLGRAGHELYIYPNEAGIFGAKPHAWFEEWDYPTPEELIGALAKECANRAA